MSAVEQTFDWLLDTRDALALAIHDVWVGDIARIGGSVVSFTESQGEFHTPWGVFAGGKTMQCDDGVGRALRALGRRRQRQSLNGSTERAGRSLR
jgi:hypothetical protein